MDANWWENYVRRIAVSRCKAKHRGTHDELICVGPGSEKGFSPPCDECLSETRAELEAKRGKAHGTELTSEESEEIDRMLELD